VSAGWLAVLGVGPGDPELLTLKAVARLRAADVVAFVTPDGRPSLARAIAASHLRAGQREIGIDLPMRADPEPGQRAYDDAAERLRAEVDAGRGVALLCEGDPLLYGSARHLLDRLADLPVEIVPGITSACAAAAAARWPLGTRDQGFTLIPATVGRNALIDCLAATDSVAILKPGKRLAEIREVLRERGWLASAVYAERVGTSEQRIVPLAELDAETAPYFALVLARRPR
jgi:precorrin-2 C(20)-methyltransferase